jgi:hypothetical protein
MDNRVVELDRDVASPGSPSPARATPDYGPDGATWGHRWGFVLEPDGDDATLVRQSYDCSKLPDHERAGMDGGRMWLPAMDETLARLEALVLSSGP